MTYGFIIAAGNQTRFNSNVPKALSKLGNKTCLDYTISRLNNVCDIVYIVCSKEKEDYFIDYKNIISIESGLGCGDAVLKAFKKFNFNSNDKCFIQWGDSILEDRIYTHLKYYSYEDSDINIACRFEHNPYVKLLSSNFNKHVDIYFSKYNEVHGNGLHDLSLFYGNPLRILKYCEIFCNKFFDGNLYKHKHGNEFNFLDIMNETDIIASVVIINKVKSYSFNTEDEYEHMLKEIKELKWI